MKQIYSMHLIETPTGKFVWRGRVPAPLCCQFRDDKTPVTDDDFVLDQMRLPASYRVVKDLAFDTRDEANAYAKYLGFM